MIDNLIFKNKSLLIPKKLRPEMLKIIHEGHMGIERCKNLIKDLIFWPNINSDIKNIVENCDACMKYKNNNSKEPLILHNVPQIPWFKLGTDIFHFNNKIYLLVVDYFSKFIEIAHLSSGFTAVSVIQHLKSMFARFGIPSVLVSDNGPPFNSLEFKQFIFDWDIEHVTSSPNYPQSNGLAERSIQTIKKLFKKCKESNNDPYISLMQYHNTPKGNLYSPSQLLMSRSIRTKLPVKTNNLKPKLIKLNEYLSKVKIKTDKTTEYYNKKTKNLKPLTLGENVLFKLVANGPWIKGKVIQIHKFPRSYIVESEKGGRYRRNRQHLITSVLTTSKTNNYLELDSQSKSNSTADVICTRSGRKVVRPKKFNL